MLCVVNGISMRQWHLKRYLFIVLLLIGFVWLGIKLWLVNDLVRALHTDMQTIVTMGIPEMTALPAFHQTVRKTRGNVAALQQELRPVLPLVEQLDWVPQIGPSLAAAPLLLDLAADLSLAGDELLTVASPLLTRQAEAGALGEALVQQLLAEQARLLDAREALGRAQRHYDAIATETLVVELAEPLARLEPWLLPAQDVVEATLRLPELLGATEARRYLVLIQNPDELRPTGGFITGIAVVTLAEGRLEALVIDDVTVFDDFEALVYPPAPMPLTRYMGLGPWVLRDSNWSPDFPSSAAQAARLFTLAGNEAPDGVLAVTPSLIRLLIDASGPIVLPEETEAFDAEGALDYLRASWDPGQALNAAWAEQKGKALQELARALQASLVELDQAALEQLGPGLHEALRRRDLQISLIDPTGAALLARYHWDGAVRPGNADFLMLVDANLGYNKANVHIQRSASYTVDLRQLDQPTATLHVQHRHTLADALPCTFQVTFLTGDYATMTRGCYWNYLRVVVPGGSLLRESSTSPSPGAWMWGGRPESGQVTTEIGPRGATLFATMMVVPTADERTTTLTYQLPSTVLRQTEQTWTYHLLVQAQAGISPVPLTVTVKLPNQARPVHIPASGHFTDGQIVLDLVIDRDAQIELSFEVPTAINLLPNQTNILLPTSISTREGFDASGITRVTSAGTR